MNTSALPTRREFLATTAAAAVAIGAARAADASPYGNWNIGAQSYSFRDFDLEQALKNYQTLGLKFAEFFSKHVPPNSSPEQIKAILNTCKQYGVTPIAYGVQDFTKNHDANRKNFELAKALGIKYLSANPTEDAFDSLDKLVDEYKIAIGIHPHGPGGRPPRMTMHRWYSAEKILEAVKNRHPLIGTCIDTGHILRCVLLDVKLDPADQIRKMGARNFGLHLKDFDFDRKEECIVGKGMLNVAEVLKALKEVKFTGYINLEYELNSKNPAPDMAVGLKAVEAAVKKVG